LPSFMEEQLKLFHISKASKIFKSVKSAGVPFLEVFKLLLVLPFTMSTTDTNLGFVRMIEIYHTRWAIEVFFKEVKQLLSLGKNQSTNFDVQVAQTTITMIQYLLISLKFRQQAYETLNGLFKDLKQEYIEHKLNERILLAIVEILAVLDFLVPDFDFDETLSKLIEYADDTDFIRNIRKMLNLNESAA